MEDTGILQETFLAFYIKRRKYLTIFSNLAITKGESSTITAWRENTIHYIPNTCSYWATLLCWTQNTVTPQTAELNASLWCVCDATQSEQGCSKKSLHVWDQPPYQATEKLFLTQTITLLLITFGSQAQTTWALHPIIAIYNHIAVSLSACTACYDMRNRNKLP